jgi:hypothetical protein
MKKPPREFWGSLRGLIGYAFGNPTFSFFILQKVKGFVVGWLATGGTGGNYIGNDIPI